VNSDVETKKLNKCFIIAKTKEVCKVSGVILARVDSGQLAIAKHIAEYAPGDIGQFGNPMDVNILSVSWP
jgi:hypothetical protein